MEVLTKTKNTRDGVFLVGAYVGRLSAVSQAHAMRRRTSQMVSASSASASATSTPLSMAWNAQKRSAGCQTMVESQP